MAVNYIGIDSTKPLGFKLRGAVDGLLKSITQLKQLQAIMMEQNAGTDWSVMEGRFGIDLGKGAQTKNLLTDALAEIAADPNLQKVLTYFEPTL